MPIEINGQKSEPYIDLRGLKNRATFKITAAPLKAHTEKGIIEKPLASCSILASYTKINAHGGHDIVRYYKSKTPLPAKNNGEGNNYLYEPNFVMIENGQLNVNTVTDKDLYYFLLNHPNNQSNPAYETDSVQPEQAKLAKLLSEGVNFLFYEINPKKTNKIALELERKKDEAKRIILEAAQLNDKQIVELYKAYNFTDAEELLSVDDYDSMRMALVNQANNDPNGFMAKVESASTFLYARVNDALNKGIIKCEILENQNFGWNWADAQLAKAKKHFLEIPSHEYGKKEELLVEWLTTTEKGIKISDQLKQEINLHRLKVV